MGNFLFCYKRLDVFFYLWRYGDLSQGLAHSRQVLYNGTIQPQSVFVNLYKKKSIETGDMDDSIGKVFAVQT